MPFHNNIEYWRNRYKQRGLSNTVGPATYNAREQRKLWDVMAGILSSYTPTRGCLLDFGCGGGRFCEFLSRRADYYFGCDIVEEVVYANVSAFSHIPFVQFGIMKDNTIPFGNAKFDTIITVVVLQHVIDDELLSHYFRQFANRLKPGGRLIIFENMAGKVGNDYIKFRRSSEYAAMMADYFTGEAVFSKDLYPGEAHKVMVCRPLGVSQESVSEASLPKGPVRLNLGCGDDIKEGYLNVDICQRRGVFVADAASLPFPDAYAEEILALDLIEHFSIDAVPSVLQEWARVLRAGGQITIRTPDIERTAEIFYPQAKSGRISWARLSKIIYGGQDYPSNFHHVGLSYSWLESLMLKKGFAEIRRAGSFKQNMTVRGLRR
jgi:SAM-dependent methyltransferase